MLPDFPETKILFTRFFQRYMRQRTREISPFRMVQSRHLHEGRGMKVTRADETESESQMELLSSQMEIKVEEIENLTFEGSLKKHEAVVVDIVRKQTTFALGRLDNDIPESQTVSAKGRKPDGALLLDMFDAVQTDFYPDGRPHELHVVGGLFSKETLAAAQHEIQTDPALAKRLEEMMARKKEEWRAREASRKLVG